MLDRVRESRSRFAARSNVLWTILATGAITGSALIAGVLVARNLGPEGRGVLAALTIWAAFALDIALFGSRQATVFFTASTSGTERSTAWDYIRRTTVAQSLVGIAVFALIASLRGTGALIPLLVVVLFAIKVPAQVVFAQRSSYLQGIYDMRSFNIARFVVGAGPMVLILAAALMGMLTLVSASLAYVAAVAMGALVSAGRVRKANRGEGKGSTQASWSGKRAYWAYSAKSFVSVMATKGNREIDLLVLSVLSVGVASLGHYAVAVTAGHVASILGSSIGMIVFPRVAGEKSIAGRRSLVVRASVLVAVGSIVVAVPVAVGAPQLIGLIYGEPFLPAVELTRIMAIGGVALSMSILLAAVLQALNRVGILAFAHGSGFIVTLVGAVSWQIHGDLRYVAGMASAGFVVSLLIMAGATWHALRPSADAVPSALR